MSARDDNLRLNASSAKKLSARAETDESFSMTKKFQSGGL